MTKGLWIVVMTAALALIGLQAGLAQQDTADIAIERADKALAFFTVELAVTEAAQERGLMFRETLPQGQGMLFVYEKPARRLFWMKDTLIPLDILFFDRRHELVHIHSNAKPGSLKMVGPDRDDVCAVLEIGGGEAKRLGLKVGDRLGFSDLACQ